jgi:DNA-binding MarR family transcriptional regulator
MDLLETYQKSIWVIKYLKRNPSGRVTGPGVSIDEIARALRMKSADIYPAIDYLIKEGYVVRPDEGNNGLIRLTYKALTTL